MRETQQDLEGAWDALVDDLRQATYDQHVSERLRRVDTLVALRVRGHDHLECGIRFDVDTIEVVDGPADGTPGITVEMPPDMVFDFWNKKLPLAILRGDATYEGPVRRFLSVLPIFSSHAKAPQEKATPTETA